MITKHTTTNNNSNSNTNNNNNKCLFNNNDVNVIALLYNNTHGCSTYIHTYIHAHTDKLQLKCMDEIKNHNQKTKKEEEEKNTLKGI